MGRLLPKRNTKILASISRKVKMLIHHVFIPTSIFFNWSLPSLGHPWDHRTKVQLKFPARGEELALERVVEVVVHAKQQIRIVTQTVSVADVPAMKWLNVRQLDTVLKQLNVRQSDIFPYFSSKSKKCLSKNVLPLFTILKRFQAAKSFELDVFRQPSIQSTKPSKRLTLRNFSMTRPDTILK